VLLIVIYTLAVVIGEVVIKFLLFNESWMKMDLIMILDVMWTW